MEVTAAASPSKPLPRFHVTPSSPSFFHASILPSTLSCFEKKRHDDVVEAQALSQDSGEGGHLDTLGLA